MPKSCNHFRLLEDRLLELSGKFVDDQVLAENNDPSNFVPDLDRLAAYRLLIHAEVEDFLEQKAIENLDSVINRKVGGLPWMRFSPEMIFMVIAQKKQLPNTELLEAGAFSSFIDELLVSSRAAISANNGVKSASFVLLSVLAGKMVDEIDGSLSATLNSYGRDRGDVAHKSVTRSRTISAASAELNSAKAIVQGLGAYYDVCR